MKCAMSREESTSEARRAIALGWTAQLHEERIFSDCAWLCSVKVRFYRYHVRMFTMQVCLAKKKINTDSSVHGVFRENTNKLKYL